MPLDEWIKQETDPSFVPEAEYEVEAIVAERLVENKLQFLVKWTACPFSPSQYPLDGPYNPLATCMMPPLSGYRREASSMSALISQAH